MTEVSLAGRASFSLGPSSLELLTKKLEGGCQEVQVGGGGGDLCVRGERRCERC